MAEHHELAEAPGIQVFVCRSKGPWQPGTNVNTNRHLRRYLRKDGALRRFSMRNLDDIARLNTRRRRALEWDTAHDRF